jgi:transglutaminase superfamily protein
VKNWWSRSPEALFPLRVLLFAAAVPLLLRFRKLPNLPAWLEPRGEVPPAPPPEQVAALVRRIDSLVAAGSPVVRSGCLVRGLTLYRFLRLAGADVSLHFGVGAMRGRFAAHCWIIYRGEPLAEPRDPRPLFTETWRVEPSPQLSEQGIGR